MKLSESSEELKFTPIKRKNEMRYNPNTTGKAKNRGFSKAGAVKLIAGLSALIVILSINNEFNAAKDRVYEAKGIEKEYDYANGLTVYKGDEPDFQEIVEEMFSHNKNNSYDISNESSLGR